VYAHIYSFLQFRLKTVKTPSFDGRKNQESSEDTECGLKQTVHDAKINAHEYGGVLNLKNKVVLQQTPVQNSGSGQLPGKF